MASPNISELITTTLEHRNGNLADGMSENTALLYRLREKENVKPIDGGYEIREEIAYAENGTVDSYSGAEKLDITPSDVFTSAVFERKQYAVSITITGAEELANTGRAQKIDLAMARMENAKASLINRLSADIYLDGTGNGGRNLLGLAILVPDDPTAGTVGGINRATASNAFWRSKVQTASSVSVTPGPTTIVGLMRRAWQKTVRNKEAADLVIADDVYWGYFHDSFEGKQQVINTKLAEAGFQNIKFMGADVVLDGGFGGSATANHMWFLNTKYIYLRPDKSRDFKSLGQRKAVDQDATVTIVGWSGAFTSNNLGMQSLLIA